MNENRPYTRSEPRIPLKALHDVSFVTEIKGKEESIPITNISTKGIGFLRLAELDLPTEGILPGTVNVGGQSFPINPNIVFANDSALGCQMKDSSEEFCQAIRSYFQIELMALSLVKAESLYDCGENDSLIFMSGPNNCEVLIIDSPEKMVRFKITFYGNVFDGGETRRLSVGEIVQGDPDFDNTEGGKLTITKSLPALGKTTANAVLKFIDFFEFLDDKQKSIITSKIDSYPIEE